MSEKYDFSKIENQQKFEQLPPEEKEAVIGAAQEEMAEIHKKARALAGEGEKPTEQNYQKAAEQIDGEKEKSEIILTPEQERMRKILFERLCSSAPGGHIQQHDKLRESEQMNILLPNLDEVTLKGDELLEYKRKKGFLPHEVILEIGKEAIITKMKQGRTNSASEILKAFPYSNEIIKRLTHSVLSTRTCF